MFLGHFAAAFAAKKAEPSGPLVAYVLAAQFPDVIWPVFLLAGVEHVTVVPGDTAVTPLRFDSYPYSHSLLTVGLWAGVVGGLYYLSRRHARTAWLIGLLVLSHWVLDAVSHRPDMPLLPGSPRVVGLGLWYSVPATVAVELTLFGAGVALYQGATRTRDRAGRWGLQALIAFLTLIYVGNILGPPPPGPREIAIVALLGAAILAGWAAWVDSHRTRT